MESSAEMLKEIACPNIIVKPLKKAYSLYGLGKVGYSEMSSLLQ